MTQEVSKAQSKNRIDLHQHLVPPFWAESLPDHGGDPSGWSSPEWSPDMAISYMDAAGIAKGVLSLTAPSVVGWEGEERRAMARQVNDYAANLVKERPDRFGNFATLPLPDVEGAVIEAKRALDELGADGVVVMSNYGGKYLGDEDFEPLWKVLNERSATVFIHPGAPAIDLIPGIPGPAIDYPFDTTRTAVHMVLNKVLERFNKAKFILSHAGGFVPYAASRFAVVLGGLYREDFTEESVMEQLKDFYYDIALSSTEVPMVALTSFARQNHVVFGSDFPYAPEPIALSFAQRFDAITKLTDEQHSAINHGNAKALVKDASGKL